MRATARPFPTQNPEQVHTTPGVTLARPCPMLSPRVSEFRHRRLPRQTALHRGDPGLLAHRGRNFRTSTRAPLPCYSPLPLLPPWRSSRRLSHGAWATAGSGQEKAISTSCRPWLSSGNVAAGRLRITICARAQSSRDGVPSRTMSGMRWGRLMKLALRIRVRISRELLAARIAYSVTRCMRGRGAPRKVGIWQSLIRTPFRPC